MGDCRLRFLVSMDLCDSKVGLAKAADHPEGNNRKAFTSLSRLWSADTTIREVVEELLLPIVGEGSSLSLLVLLEQKMASIWDCTFHPPKDISDWPFRSKERMSSPTLLEMGWFPSGTIQILPPRNEPMRAATEDYDDFQYNQRLVSSNSSSTQAVRLRGASRILPMPSQVLESVTHRHGHVDVEETEKAMKIRKQNRHEVLRKQSDKFRQLEGSIRKLEESSTQSATSSKNRRVSDQVRRMLIKSRATGRTQTKVEDRIYVHCVVIIDQVGNVTTTKEEYLYFSPQDTVGAITSKFEVPGKEVELLIKCSDGETSTPVYRRLSLLMRLYEARSNAYLDEVNQVVIRVFNPLNDEATEIIARCDQEKGQASDEARLSTDRNELEDNGAMAEPCPLPKCAFIIHQRLASSLVSLDKEARTSGKKKAVSEVSEKVRQMKLKSSAKGDSKRVAIHDRLFLELIEAVDDGVFCCVTSSPIFLSRQDPLDRVVRDFVKDPGAGWRLDILIPTPGDPDSFRVVNNPKLSLDEAESDRLVASFGRIIVLVHSTDLSVAE